MVADKQKILQEIKDLHQRLLAELDKIIVKLDNYSREQMAQSREAEKRAMDDILAKIKNKL